MFIVILLLLIFTHSSYRSSNKTSIEANEGSKPSVGRKGTHQDPLTHDAVTRMTSDMCFRNKVYVNLFAVVTDLFED